MTTFCKETGKTISEQFFLITWFLLVALVATISCDGNHDQHYHENGRGNYQGHHTSNQESDFYEDEPNRRFEADHGYGHDQHNNYDKRPLINDYQRGRQRLDSLPEHDVYDPPYEVRTPMYARQPVYVNHHQPVYVQHHQPMYEQQPVYNQAPPRQVFHDPLYYAPSQQSYNQAYSQDSRKLPPGSLRAELMKSGTGAILERKLSQGLHRLRNSKNHLSPQTRHQLRELKYELVGREDPRQKARRLGRIAKLAKVL